MADVVHFLTIDDGVNSSGCSGFPFPVLLTGPGTIDVFPIILPLEVQNSASPSCAMLYWRINELSLATDMSVTAAAVTVNLPNGAVANNPSITRELDLINPASATLNIRRWKTSDNNATITAFNTPDGSEPQLWLDGTDYKPSFVVEGVLTAADGADDITLEFNTIQGVLIQSITATLLGVSFTLYYDITAQHGTNSYTFTSFDITADSFFPYEGADGNPIYDTADGLWLQDPRN